VMEEQPLYLSVRQAGRRLGVGPARAYALAAAGVFPTIRRGRRILVPAAAFARWAAAEAERALAEIARPNEDSGR
jgi:excisionase family DNA binding protein